MDKDRFSVECIADIINMVPGKYRKGILQVCISDLFRHCGGSPRLSLDDTMIMKKLMEYESPRITTVRDIEEKQ